MVTTKEIAVLGLPFDAYSSYMKGPALAPGRIREALFCDSSNLCTEDRTDLGAVPGWQLLADLELSDPASAFLRIEDEVGRRLEAGQRILALGGDHAVTLPLVRAHARQYPDLNILHFDAHPDLYDRLDGNPYSHACPFARIMEENLAGRLVQVGIRTMTVHQQAQADRFGVEVIDMNGLPAAAPLSFDGPVYVSLDLDCLDPAFAPGVSHHEPGGMTTRELLHILGNVQGDIVGADIVEYNPLRDINGMTGMVAAKLLKELLGKLLK